MKNINRLLFVISVDKNNTYDLHSSHLNRRSIKLLHSNIVNILYLYCYENYFIHIN